MKKNKLYLLFHIQRFGLSRNWVDHEEIM